MDLILCSDLNASQGEQARTALRDGYRNGTLGHAAFNAALQRIIALRSGLPG